MFVLREEYRIEMVFVTRHDLAKFQGRAMPERLEMVREAPNGPQRVENRDLTTVGHARADERSSVGW